MCMQKQYRLLKTKLRFLKKLGYWPNIRSPSTFNEKIQHRKFYSQDSRYSLCSDKYAVRDYVAQRIKRNILIPLLDVVDKPNQLDFKSYGNNFVVKASHDSGSVHICKDGNYDTKAITQKIDRALKIDNGIKRDEYWYSQIQPKVIVEALLRHKDGRLPEDYKFHVFTQDEHQHVVVQVDYNREQGHHRTFYTPSGEILPFEIDKKSFGTELKTPEHFNEMIQIAKQLGGEFDYVRVDLYNIDGEIYFGELTFAHGSGFRRFKPASYDKTFGDYWRIQSSC